MSQRRGEGGAETQLAVAIVNVPDSQEWSWAQADGYNIHQAARWSHDDNRRLFDAAAANGMADFFAANPDGSGLHKPGTGRSPTGRPTAPDGRSSLEIGVISDRHENCKVGFLGESEEL